MLNNTHARIYTTTNPCIQLTIVQLRWDNINITETPFCYSDYLFRCRRRRRRLFVDSFSSLLLLLLQLLCHFCRLLISHELIFIYFRIDWHSMVDLLTLANSSSSLSQLVPMWAIPFHCGCGISTMFIISHSFSCSPRYRRFNWMHCIRGWLHPQLFINIFSFRNTTL